MSLTSPLRRVLGPGSAKQGVQHWWVQRLTSVALVPLTIWFAVSLIALPGLDHATVVAWLRHGVTAVLLLLLVLLGAWHSQLGLRVIVEDYLHGSGTKTLALVLLTFLHVLLAAITAFAILRLALRGGA